MKDIWVTYLSKFVKRYGKTKLDRTRELFEQAVEAVWILFFFKFLVWLSELINFVSISSTDISFGPLIVFRLLFVSYLATYLLMSAC